MTGPRVAAACGLLALGWAAGLAAAAATVARSAPDTFDVVPNAPAGPAASLHRTPTRVDLDAVIRPPMPPLTAPRRGDPR